MTLRLAFAAAIFAVSSSAAWGQDAPSLADLAFLEGHWRGGAEDLAFEEIWSGAEGGVMTAMARGASGDQLRVLEYVVVTEGADGVIMRFKHYNADFSTWEKDGPTTLALTSAAANDVTFTADPPSESVKSIRYHMTGATTLAADIVLVQNGEVGGFSLIFTRVR